MVNISIKIYMHALHGVLGIIFAVPVFYIWGPCIRISTCLLLGYLMYLIFFILDYVICN